MTLSKSTGAETAIPTEYNGINFRSRLEATWAAFFDLCGWKWEYEPFDLPGYIPDFLLRGSTNFLVDVRPMTDLAQYEKRAEELRDACKGHEVLVLGAGLLNDGWHISIGIMSESQEEEEPPGYFSEAVLMTCSKCGKRSFYHEEWTWKSRICGHYEGDHYLGDFDDAPAVWAQAKNATQWRAVTPRNR